MFGRESKPPAAVDILIGKSARIRGDIDFAGGLHLDGCVAGHVRASPDLPSTLSVSESGSIEGSAEADNVILNGTVHGDIVASGRVALGPRAKVHGDVHYGVIETALGAEILGRLVPAPARSGSDRAVGSAAGAVGSAAGGRIAADRPPAERALATEDGASGELAPAAVGPSVSGGRGATG
ncbi:MAG TPA: polymer-forming cytoskeletal protein [Steroidobacteraceae bacterium]|nr:polymer-forming cytoskeletal protein [Steroidobacteraceae bacterium]